MAGSEQPIEFTLDELWFLHSVVKHDMANADAFRSGYPPVSQDLNYDICDAILLCIDDNQESATLLLSKGDCLLLDYCVPQDAKDANNTPIGENVLLKTFRARRALQNVLPGAEGGEELENNLEENVARFKEKYDIVTEPWDDSTRIQQQKRRQRRKK